MYALYFLVFCCLILFVIIWGMLRDDMHDDWDESDIVDGDDVDGTEAGDP